MLNALPLKNVALNCMKSSPHSTSNEISANKATNAWRGNDFAQQALSRPIRLAGPKQNEKHKTKKKRTRESNKIFLPSG